MDKNTIWAIVLSTAVIGGFIFFQQKFMMPTNQQTAPAAVEKNADTAASGTAQRSHKSLCDRAGSMANAFGKLRSIHGTNRLALRHRNA